MNTLTHEKLLDFWRNRKQYFQAENNKWIVDRYEFLSALFKEMLEMKVEYSDDNTSVSVNGVTVLDKDGKSPSLDYFGCDEDGISSEGAFKGVSVMMDRYPQFKDIIGKMGCMMGGFDSPQSPDMYDEYRIISNRITAANDNGSLTSIGQSRQPSSNFADNNYFFKVIQTVKQINECNYQHVVDNGEIVLRYPQQCYYPNLDRIAIKAEMLKTLDHRFPYKFFYMWVNADSMLHLIGLQAYKKLIHYSDPFQFQEDSNMDEDFVHFTSSWPAYSKKICDLIPEEERGTDFINELSLLLSLITIQDQDIRNIRELVETGNKAVILYGPPGTGKTYQAKKLASSILGEAEIEKIKFPKIGEKGSFCLVQFHPNYTYEDFIGGISPTLDGNSLSYTLKVGKFKAFCDMAAEKENEDKKFVFIIDEINRANLSAVFGELMYALEYRGESIDIPNFNKKFVIPANVYLIGTMNDVDKSLVNFDLALRRRFSFYYVGPQMEVLSDILENCNIKDEQLASYIERCKQLNRDISDENGILQLGPSYQIGHAYFGKIKDYMPKSNDSQPVNISQYALEKLWVYNLEPLLKEYLGNRIEDRSVAEELNKEKEKFTAPLI
jgi:hypothetical protein